MIQREMPRALECLKKVEARRVFTARNSKYVRVCPRVQVVAPARQLGRANGSKATWLFQPAQRVALLPSLAHQLQCSKVVKSRFTVYIASSCQDLASAHPHARFPSLLSLRLAILTSTDPSQHLHLRDPIPPLITTCRRSLAAFGSSSPHCDSKSLHAQQFAAESGHRKWPHDWPHDSSR